jgi:uncharacterized membrane protein YfcA
VFFAISELFLNPFLVLVTGIAGGFVSGFLGAGCGVVITPVLFEFGLSPFTAVSTQLCHAVGTNLSNFLAYKRKRDVDFHLALYILLGGGLGAFCEWLILMHRPSSETAFQKFAYVYVVTLLIFSFTMVLQGIKSRKTKAKVTYGMASVIMKRWMLYLPLHKIFRRSRTEMSIFVPIFVGFTAGMIVSAIGGGNNIFMAPIIIYLIGRMSPVVQGTSSLAGFAITMIVSLVYAERGYTCDFQLVILLLAGASIGSWIGVNLTYYVKGIYVSIISAAVVFFMAVRMVCKIVSGAGRQLTEAASNKSTIFAFASERPLLYTGICIVLVCATSITFEKTIMAIFKKSKIDQKKDHS